MRSSSGVILESPLLTLLTFLALVFIGGYVQTVAGFAMGMILIAGSSALQLYPLPVTAAVVSLVSFLNIVLSLTGHLDRVRARAFLAMLIGQLPMLAVGVWLLMWLDSSAERVLRMLLGGFILAGCTAMMIRPEPLPRVSSSAAFAVAGMGGGLLGGLFSAAGPVLGWFVYRQPWRVAEIRATLLAAFAVSTVARTGVVGADGGLTGEVWTLTAWSVPLVLVSVWLGRRFPPPLGERALRRAAFALLCAMGGWILLAALLETP